MKLATFDNGRRDGALCIVSRDLKRYVDVGHIAPTLQAALDQWSDVSPALERFAEELESCRCETQDFQAEAFLSPLPRAYQWADGSAYLSHLQRLYEWRGSKIPKDVKESPLLYQGGSDAFLAPTGDITLPNMAWDCDFEAEVAVITDDVSMGVTVDEAAARIRLVMLCNDVSLRGLVSGEKNKELGFVQSKPSSAFSPVAVTLDELGDAWADCRVALPIRVDVNGMPFGRANAGKDARFGFADLIAHAAATRRIGAGAIFGLGTVSNYSEDGRPGKSLEDGGPGFSCITERRVEEQLSVGEAATPFLRHGDEISIEMLDNKGRSVFGAIRQRIIAFGMGEQP